MRRYLLSDHFVANRIVFLVKVSRDGMFLRYLNRLIRPFLIVGLLTFGSVAAVATLWPRNAPMPKTADAIICLAGGMSYSGWDLPGPASARRAQTCAELQLAGVAPVVVFTGYGHELMSAAEAMAQLAASEGVSPDAILLESKALSTIQNAAFSLDLLPEDAKRIVLVSDAFHLPRSWLTFRLLGAPETALFAARMEYSTEDKPAAKNYFEWVLRETIAIWFNIGRGLVYMAGGLMGIDEPTRIAWFK